ncbi:MAG: response regulator [Parcubacteria group bacterium]|jgi:two-component system chemotaxis response regulator CheY
MKKKVLIIDDHAEIREMYEAVLRLKDYDVCSEPDGLRGAMRAAEFKPDVILLDLMMPKMDGFTVLDALKNNHAISCKTIVVSNLSNQQEEERALKSGADKFLRKSDYTPNQIAEEVQKVLETT